MVYFCKVCFAKVFRPNFVCFNFATKLMKIRYMTELFAFFSFSSCFFLLFLQHYLKILAEI